MVQGGSKAKPMIMCANKECGYKRAVEEAPAASGEQAAEGVAAAQAG